MASSWLCHLPSVMCFCPGGVKWCCQGSLLPPSMNRIANKSVFASIQRWPAVSPGLTALSFRMQNSALSVIMHNGTICQSVVRDVR